ncbi:MAG TPA: isocitrate lyase/phosphoenolpyruvate mutase family protein [Thermoanaerobaculia bacterium]|jgi:2-methylisocitrate lyase-like PEP mutase family enzyme
MSDLEGKADTLRSLHVPSRPLVLVNVWDSASARIVAKAGAPAIATTSAGVAFANGYPDGQRIPRERMLEAVARVCAAVSIPVSADLESGYGDSAESLERTVAGMLEAGAVGLNLEDHSGAPTDPLVEPELQVDKIRAVREAGSKRGVPIVLNARTDSYLRGLGSKEEMFAETIRRGEAYRDAGADCVFVPGLMDPAVIGEIVKRLACPVNVLAVAGSPPIAELARLGVARVSLGSGPMRAAMTVFRRLTEEVLAKGTYSAMDGIDPHRAFNDLMSGEPR